MISVIIPVYNVAPYIDRCVQSVLNQIHQDWECILVDDGSTDESGHLCDKWTMHDSRIKVIHQVNQGVSVARNNGIDASLGEYIVFIDSDDWVEPNYLQDLYNNKECCELVVSGLVGERENGADELCMPLATTRFLLSSENIEDFIHLNRNALLYGPMNKLFVARIIKKNKIQFPVYCAYGEDLLFSFQYLEYVNKIATVKNLSYHYIMRDQTLSRRVREDQFDNDYKLWTTRRDFMIKRGLWSFDMQKVMYAYLWGQVYNGIFLSPQLKDVKYNYLERILSIPEIEELSKYKDIVPCSTWIKYAILNRWSWLFYLYFKTVSWNLLN